jgi:adenosylcobinamide-GDP ribazoletransferase
MPLARTLWAFPLVGAAVGAIGAAAFAMFAAVPALGAVAALGAMALATGALHEDGLADTADGFGGGRTAERKRAIMRDSRIGTFGAIALMLTLGARGTALAALADPVRASAALVASAAIGRACILLPVLAMRPAQEGLAAPLLDRRPATVLAGLALAAFGAFALLSPGPALQAMAGAAAATLALGVAAQRQIGGYTGDVLGATAVLGETAALAAVAMAAAPGG